MAKEETKKALGLVGAIFAVFVCAGWRIVGATKPPAAPAPPAAETVQASASTTGGTTTPETPESSEEPQIEVPSIMAMGSSDPFKWLVKPNSGRMPSKPIGSATLPFPGAALTGPLTPLPTAGPQVQPVKEPEVRLTGVLPGANAVAVVEVGDTSYVVRKGERFADGYVMDTIGTDRVAVLHAGKRTRVVLGE